MRNPQRNPPTASNTPRKIIKPEEIYREALTARDYSTNKDEELIMGILKSAREIKRVFRKHSVELKKEQVSRKKIYEF